MTSMIDHLYSPYWGEGEGDGQIYIVESQRKIKTFIIRHPIARNNCWSSGIEIDMFNVPMQLKYIHLQLSCPTLPAFK